MTMWCPNGHGEFRDGVTTCGDCGSPLVATAPAEAHVDERMLTNDDVLVEVERVPAMQGEVIAAVLRDAGIPAVSIGPGTYTVGLPFSEGVRVMVRQGDLERARAVLREADIEAREMPLTEDELAELAEHATVDADPDDGAVV